MCLTKVHEFQGKEGDVAEGWIREMRENIAGEEMTHLEARRFIKINLAGKAREWVDQLKPSETQDWETLLDKIGNHWNAWNAASTSRESFHSRKQKSGETAHNFLEDLIMLRKKGYPDESTEGHEEHVIEQFSKFLLDKKLYQFLLARLANKSSTEKIRIKDYFDGIHAYNRQIRTENVYYDGNAQQQTPMSSGTQQQQVPRTNTNNSIRPQGNQSSRPRPTNVPPGACFECGKMGHKVAQCRQYRTYTKGMYEIVDDTMVEDDSMETEEFFESTILELTKGKCYNCNKPGHFQDKCPEPKRPRKIDNMEKEIEALRKLIEGMQRDNDTLRREINQQSNS